MKLKKLFNNHSVTKEKELVKLNKRLLKACLQQGIMALLKKKSFLGATDIISIIEKRFNILLSAGTLYPILDTLESEGKIRRLPNRRKRIYFITNKGKETLIILDENREELIDFLLQIFDYNNK